MELVFFALDHGINSIRGGGPLIPFLITQGRERNLMRFVTERLEYGVKKAQEAAASLDATINQYAIAYDGYLTIEGTKYDAILVEADDVVRYLGLAVIRQVDAVTVVVDDRVVRDSW